MKRRHRAGARRPPRCARRDRSASTVVQPAPCMSSESSAVISEYTGGSWHQSESTAPRSGRADRDPGRPRRVADGAGDVDARQSTASRQRLRRARAGPRGRGEGAAGAVRIPRVMRGARQLADRRRRTGVDDLVAGQVAALDHDRRRSQRLDPPAASRTSSSVANRACPSAPRPRARWASRRRARGTARD